jgi:hypothetical protein
MAQPIVGVLVARRARYTRYYQDNYRLALVLLVHTLHKTVTSKSFPHSEHAPRGGGEIKL